MTSTFIVTVTVTPGSTTREVAHALRSVLRESGIDPASDIFSRPRVKSAGKQAASHGSLLPRSPRTASRATVGTLLAETRPKRPKAPRGAERTGWGKNGSPRRRNW
jgi:FAD/FMN-containing dehydrogenase